MVKTLQGGEAAPATAGGVMFKNAKVVSADVPSSNGVIHAVDTVLMPKQSCSLLSGQG